MRIFVTGANGFIGSALVRRLVASGSEVVCLLRERSDVSRIADLRYTRVTGDVRTPESFASAVEQCDAVMHLAAPGGWAADDPAVLDAVIVQGTRNVLDVAGRAGRRVVFVSSTAAVNASNEPVLFDETSAFTMTHPSLAYALAKHRAEEAARQAFARGTDVVTVNPAEVYGPGDTALGTAGNLLDFATSTPVLICAGGTSIVHVDDVVSGIIAALERGRAGERYILGGENLTIESLARLVLELRSRSAPVLKAPRPVVRLAARAAVATRIPVPFNPHVVPYATRYWFMNNAKARRELGLEFRDARAVIGETLAWLQATGRLASL